MKHSLHAPLTMLFAIMATSSLVAQSVIYDGSAFSQEFGNGSGTGVVGGSPNSAVDQAAELTFSGGFNTVGWEATGGFVPDDIDWSQGGLQFDYKTTSPDADVFKMQVLYFDGGSDTTVVAPESVTGLNADGNWHTFEWSVSDWDPEFQQLIDDGLDTSSELSSVRISLQAGTNPSTLTVDNVTMPVPEPATTSAVLGVLVIGIVLFRRSRNRNAA